MELKLFDSKSISVSKLVGSERKFSSPFLKSSHVVTVKIFPQFCSCRGISPKFSYSSTSNKATSSVDQENFVVETFPYPINGSNGVKSSLYFRDVRVLDACDDEYGGVIVEPERLPSDPNVFAFRLHSSLSHWKIKGKNGIWLKLPLERSELVPIAVKEGFEYHHAERGYVMLTYWIPEGTCMLPANASHQVGVGGFVINDQNEVLVVQEKHCAPELVGLWKLPTGFILESEEIFTGAVREVKEETGIDTEFVEVIAFRHAHNFAFEKSDLFFICMLRPLSTQIIVDDHEIQAAKWMPLVEFEEQPLIQEDCMFKKVIDICIARLGKRYCGLSFHQVVSKFDGKLSSLYYNIVEDQDFNCRDTMRLFPLSLSSSKEQSNGGSNRALLYLNVYDLTPINNYLYWFGLGIFHSGIEVHGLEYGFGAHEYPTSGVFEVEPRSCPGFIFRRSVLLGSIDMSRSEFRSFMEHLSAKYHGDTYHLIAKNCNHFTDEVCLRLTGKPIPGWVNRLARLGSFCNCLLPESIQVTAVRHLPDHPAYSEDGTDSAASSVTTESEEELDHHLLTMPNGDVAFLKEKPVRLAKEIL
ncbi:hypothetical protein F0562_007867 [Nyssa sinensis]|uniref:Nudix hydrolase domain-containing protein n=1 Tax=Nyssa sinensis TaxID=561372 RepID=A0A5J5A568_9ASTE|nr:hypothetical protein F0562_007867 [Nyssa sinensis]